MARIVDGWPGELGAHEHELGRDGLAGLSRYDLGHVGRCDGTVHHVDGIGRRASRIESERLDLGMPAEGLTYNDALLR